MGAMCSLFKVILEKDDVVLMDEFSFGGTKKNVSRLFHCKTSWIAKLS